MQESQWVQSGTGERYGKGDVYAFESELDAQRWASKMDWDSNSSMGTGSISIVKIKNPGGEWIVDTADPLAQSTSEGQWFMRSDAIKPENIISSTPFDGKAVQALVKASNKAMDERIRRAQDGDILASREALGQESRGTEKWTAATAKFGKEGMTKEARDARAEEQGFDMEVYSGSTFDIEAFDGDRARPDGDWGKASYASTSIEDVNSNYAGVGPDLTARLQQEAESVASVMEFDDSERDEMLEQASIPLEEYSQDSDAAHWKIASDRVVGPAGQGVVYPLRIKSGNYAVITRSLDLASNSNSPEGRAGRRTDDIKETFIEGKDFTGDAEEELNREDYEGDDAFEDAVREYADELSYGSDESLYTKLTDAFYNTTLELAGKSRKR